MSLLDWTLDYIWCILGPTSISRWPSSEAGLHDQCRVFLDFVSEKIDTENSMITGQKSIVGPSSLEYLWPLDSVQNVVDWIMNVHWCKLAAWTVLVEWPLDGLLCFSMACKNKEIDTRSKAILSDHLCHRMQLLDWTLDWICVKQPGWLTTGLDGSYW